MVVNNCEMLLSKCAQFKEERQFIDVRLKVGEDIFPVHRIVLAANSDYFYAMFTNGMKEANQEEVELKDESISPNVLKIIMESIYTGEFQVNEDNVFEVLAAADHLQVTTVVQKCCDFLLTEFVKLRFDFETYSRIWEIAHSHGLKNLQDATESEMAKMYKDVCESQEFLAHIGGDQLLSLLSRDDLNAHSETFVFKSVMQWIKHKKEERMTVAAKVIGAVRLGLVDIRELIAELDTQEMRMLPEVNTFLLESFLYSYQPSRSSEFATNKTKPRSMKSVLVAIIPKAQMQYFDFETKNWKPLPSMTQLTEADACFCAEYVGNHLYVAAQKGRDFITYHYDTVSDTWGTLPPILGGNHKIDSLCSIGDYIYAIRESKPPHRFSLKTNQWQCIKPFLTGETFPNTFCGKASVVSPDNSNLLVLHGQRKQNRNKDWSCHWAGKSAVIFCFDPERNEWKCKTSAKSVHYRSCLFLVNRKLCIAGGISSIDIIISDTPCGKEAAVEVYDEQNNEWTYVKQNRIPKNNLGAVEVEGRVYFIINNFPIDSGIRIPPEEVYPVPLDEWENLREVDNNAVLCYLPVRNESLTADMGRNEGHHGGQACAEFS